MTEDELRSGILEFLSTSSRDTIIVNLPPGTGVCHIADIEPAGWISGFVGTGAGRWRLPGDEKKSFAESFGTSAMELAGAYRERLKNSVFEVWRVTAPKPAINISVFPPELQRAFYEDQGPAPMKWKKSHILIEEAAKLPAFQGVQSVFAPSASGLALGMAGIVLVTDPRVDMEMTRTGAYADFFEE